MAKTIIQTIGPLYGEVVNGTVFGRPNGSIYVPPTNSITVTLAEAYRFILLANATTGRVCDEDGGTGFGQARSITAVAEVQDLASNIQIQVYADSDCTDLVMYRNFTAGNFNDYIRDLTIVSGKSIEDGTTYYLRAQVLNNGDPVATSSTIEIAGVVNE